MGNRLDNPGWGTLNGSRTALTTTLATQDWGLDALGNWLNFDQVVGGMTEFIQTRDHTKANEISSITNTTGDAWASVTHDSAGNMTAMPYSEDPTVGHSAVYDAGNVRDLAHI